MVPSNAEGRNLEPRGAHQVGKMCSSIETALDDLAELCGIYEWHGGPKELDPGSRTISFILEARVFVVNLKN